MRAVAFAAGELFPCGPEVAVPERGFGCLLDVFGTDGTDGTRDDGADAGCDFADKGLTGMGAHGDLLVKG